VRQADPGHQRQRLQPGDRVARRVGVDGRERPVVAGVEGGQEIERLWSADLADHDPVGAHPQRVPQEVADRHLAAPLDPGGSALQPHHVGLLEAQLGGVLDRHHPLVGGEEAGQRIQQRRLARAGAAADQDAAPRPHRLLEPAALLRIERPQLDQPLRAGALGTEAADRDRRAIDRQRRDHHVDPRAVGEAGVDHRAELVDAAAEGRQDPLDRVAQLLLVGEADRGRFDPPGALDEDAVGPVHHHLLDQRVGEQDLQRAEADAVADDAGGDLGAVGRGEDRRLRVDQFPHRLLEVGARAARRRLGAATLDQPPAQRGRQFRDVSLAGAHRPPCGITVTWRAKLSAAIRRSACGRVSPRVASATPATSPSGPAPSPSSGTAAAAT
jgi:hypothetical protein